jgi:hypothetical protein
VWWWFQKLGKDTFCLLLKVGFWVGVGLYERWVFLMASKFAFGNMVWFSFRLFLCSTFSIDMEFFEGVQMESFSMVMKNLHDTVHRSGG